ncbi:two-component system response regulator [Candidatus Poribacteria bacterium]|nr:MAG: two-component system response regulator [Candidatus Poribacteria bacterium]
MRVLVVDDSLTMRRVIKNLLAKIGITDVVEASDGLEALEVLEQTDGIELILTDWNMPNMTGTEFVEKVRSDAKYDNIPIIMVTTNASKSDIIRAIGAGVNNYIAKPFTPETIKEKIEQTMARFKKA